MIHGWLVLDKPLGLGSTQAVAAVKRALRQAGHAKTKVGHGGTLDPLATGVLPIAVGEATKLAGRMLDGDKAYDFTVRFGTQTDTLDAEGRVVASSDARPTLAEIEAVLPRFTGAIQQVPPAYSALKVDGARAYDLARAGEAVALASRDVVIHSLQILPGTGRGIGEAGGGGVAADAAPGDIPLHHAASRRGPRSGEDEVTLTAHVSKGTYIRSLARDVALALGTVGHVVMLRRTRAGPFTLAHAVSLDKLDKAARECALERLFLPLGAGLDDIPAFALTPDQAVALRQGRALFGTAAPDGPALAMLDTEPVALVEVTSGYVRVVRGFNLT